MSTQGITITINAETAAAASKLESFFHSLNSQLEGLAALAGLGFGVHELGEYVSKAVEAGQQLAQLNAALKSSGQSSAAYREELTAQREALSKVTNASADTLVSVQRLLIGFGISRDRMGQATELTLDLASAMGVDAASAAMMLGRALSGQDVSFRGLRLDIDQTLPKTQQITLALDQLSKRYGGQARSAYSAGAPDLVNFQKEMEEVQKALGQLVLGDVLTPFLKNLGATIDWLRQKFQDFNSENPRLASGLRDTSAAAGTLVGALGPVAISVLSLGVAIRAVEFAFGGIMPLITKAQSALSSLGKTELAELLRSVTSLDDAFAALDLAVESLGAAIASASVLGLGLIVAWQTAMLAIDKYHEEVSKGDAAAQMDQLNAAVKRHIDLLIQAKGYTASEGLALKKNAAALYSGWAQGKISIDEYRAKMDSLIQGINQVQRALEEADAKAKALAKAPLIVPPGQSPQAAYLSSIDSNPNSELNKSQSALDLAKASGTAARALADLDLQEAKVDADLKANRITVSEYAAALKQINVARDDARAGVSFADTANLEKLKTYWLAVRDQLIQSGAEGKEVAQAQAEVNKINVSMENAITQSVESRITAKKAELDIDDKIKAAQQAQYDVEEARLNLAIQQKEDAISNIQSDPTLSDSNKQKLEAPLIEEVNSLIRQQIQLYQEIIKAREASGQSVIEYQNKTLAAEQKIKEDLKTQTAAKNQIRNNEVGAATSMLGAMADAAKLFGRKGFIEYKILAVAQATVAGALAVLKELAQDGWWGAAAAAAVAAVQIATIMSTGYLTGGYTGDGGHTEVAGVVHRREYVMPAEAVSRIGVPALEALRHGTLTPTDSAHPSLATASATGSGSNTPQTRVIVLDDRKRMRDLKSDPQFHNVVVDIVKENLWRFRS